MSSYFSDEHWPMARLLKYAETKGTSDRTAFSDDLLCMIEVASCSLLLSRRLIVIRRRYLMGPWGWQWAQDGSECWHELACFTPTIFESTRTTAVRTSWQPSYAFSLGLFCSLVFSSSMHRKHKYRVGMFRDKGSRNSDAGVQSQILQQASFFFCL
jgi:hypothetical protein